MPEKAGRRRQGLIPADGNSRGIRLRSSSNATTGLLESQKSSSSSLLSSQTFLPEYMKRGYQAPRAEMKKHQMKEDLSLQDKTMSDSSPKDMDKEQANGEHLGNTTPPTDSISLADIMSKL